MKREAMPKIDAPTVAEHRAQKERAILDATVYLLTTRGQDAVTPAAVAELAGLARTSVYQYHACSGALVAAAIEELFRIAQAELISAMAGVGNDPELRLDRYVKVMLQLAQAGHSPNRSISLDGAPRQCRLKIRHLHEELLAPLTDIVAELGSINLQLDVALAAGTIQGAVQLVEHGSDLEQVAQQTCEFLSRALNANG